MSAWNESLEKALLIHLLDLNIQTSRARFKEVAKQMGHGLTGDACRQKFYKLKKECEQPKAGGGPSTPKAKASGPIKTPGAGRGRKRKDATVEDGGSTKKRTKKDAEEVAEEEPEEESEMEEAQDETKIKEDSAANGIAV